MAISPGLTERLLIKRALEHLWNTDLPLILDAGALIPGVFKPRKAPVIITPHPGKSSRLTGYSIEDSQKIVWACRAIRITTSSYCCFERYVTVIAFPDGTGYVNSSGNAALAKGGSGDTLTGMLLALVATEKDMKYSVTNAVFLHGLCADEYVKQKEERTMLASDITEYLGVVL